MASKPPLQSRPSAPSASSRQAVVDDVLNLAIAGPTYPFKNFLSDAGFTFKSNVNGEMVNLWLREESEAQPEVDEADLTDMFEKYGFTVDKYEGVEDDDDDDDEEP